MAKTANAFTLAPGEYGNITIGSADVIHVSAGTYNINSINFSQDGQFVVDSGPVVFNLVGNCASGCPSEGGLPSGYSSTEVIYGAGFAGFNARAPSGGTGVVTNPDVYGKVTCGPTKTSYSGIPNNLQVAYGGTATSGSVECQTLWPSMRQPPLTILPAHPWVCTEATS